MEKVVFYMVYINEKSVKNPVTTDRLIYFIFQDKKLRGPVDMLYGNDYICKRLFLLLQIKV